ncbi:YybH family protein [Portibacter lacus]|uniref:DUF4440 domain-containing protein n=1 Tax=Portibacter lacus TaxID=1099794 RepID=A0AA37WFA9_9BACT|nr:DUF4440 domain-containing protein [Portibacter lacus]GLR18342.1 hypothetical protein GCM10007940_29580 [Portibacter lacus]
MKFTIILLIGAMPFLSFSQSQEDQDAIRQVMALQQDAWNVGDLETFMAGYWKSEELRFTSSGRTSMGWQKTLDGYKKGYPTIEKMGKLKFEIFDIYPVEEKSAALTGSFYLTRSDEDLSGFFTLIFRKIDGEWKIISDMTCSN